MEMTFVVNICNISSIFIFSKRDIGFMFAIHSDSQIKLRNKNHHFRIEHST